MLNKRSLYVVLFLVTTLKLWIATHTFGTNDVKYWKGFLNFLVHSDLVFVYRAIPHYNHPPLMSLYLLGLHYLTQITSESFFPFFMRLPAILADIGSTILVYRLSRTYLSEKISVLAGLIVAASPVLISISGFHGNTDPVFIFLTLLSVYLFLVKKNLLFAGLVFGLSLNIKIVPIICVPFFFFFSQTWRHRFVFFASAAIPVIAGFSYNLMKDFTGITTNVFLYKSQAHIWGLTKVMEWYDPSIMDTRLKLCIIALLVIFSWILSRRARVAINEQERMMHSLTAFGLVFLTFLVFSPGFGVQYLSWIVPTAIFLGGYGSICYNVIAGTFLFSVYTYWSRGFPWYNADSDIVGRWRGVSETLDLLTWLFMLVWLFSVVLRAFIIQYLIEDDEQLIQYKNNGLL